MSCSYSDSDAGDAEESDRLHVPCRRVTEKFKPDQLIVTDPFCGRFFVRCCLHMNPKDVCHHSALVYTDGACSNNGKSGAVAGIGIAFGTSASDQFSIPVNDGLDPEGKRTSQRAELLAALVGLKNICDADAAHMKDVSKQRYHGRANPPPRIIVATDSEYVVKGMTEWLATWKANGFRKANGHRPSNLDLFLKLNAEVEERERRQYCRIEFWHIYRERNVIADKLAKRGAHLAANDVNEALGNAMHALVL